MANKWGVDKQIKFGKLELTSAPDIVTYFVIVAKTACLVVLVKGPSKFPINFDVVSLQSRFDVNCSCAPLLQQPPLAQTTTAQPVAVRER